MFRLEDVKNWIGCQSERKGQSGRQRLKVSRRCNAGTDETFARRICAEMFRLEGVKKSIRRF